MAINDFTDWMEDVALAEANRRIADLEAKLGKVFDVNSRLIQQKEELEQQLADMERQYMEEKSEGDRLSEQLAEAIRLLNKDADWFELTGREQTAHELRGRLAALLGEQ